MKGARLAKRFDRDHDANPGDGGEVGFFKQTQPCERVKFNRAHIWGAINVLKYVPGGLPFPPRGA